MGKFSQKKHEEANDALINAVDTASTFESLKEVLAMLSAEDGKKSFEDISEEIQNQKELRKLLEQSTERAIRYNEKQQRRQQEQQRQQQQKGAL